MVTILNYEYETNSIEHCIDRYRCKPVIIPIFWAIIKVFSSHLSNYTANTKIILIYSHSYKTIEGIYGLQNLNFPYFCKNFKIA